MKAYVVSVFVCILLFFNNVPFCAASRKGSASRDGWRSKMGDDARDQAGLGPSLGSCQVQERAIADVEENKIIRTKDSIDKGACFADAIVVKSIDECSDKCCSYSGGCNAQCDTTIFVHEPEDEVNCFLFVCGNGHGKCEFSHHTGYTTTKLSNRRKKIDSHIDKPSTTLTTTAFQQTSTYPPPTTTRKALPMLTTQTLPTTKNEEINRQDPPQKEMPEDTKISGCEHHQFQCAGSGECFVFEYVCDGIIDCKDNSDETDCGGYATTVDIITPAPITHQSNNLKVSKAPGLSSQDIAPESKKDFTSTHVASGGVKKGRVEGIDDGFSLPDSDEKKYDPGLTQQLHSKGHEGNEDDLTLNDLQKDLNALSGKNLGKDRKDQNDDFENENQKAKDKPVEYDGIEDYDSSKIWGYDEEEEDIENQKPQDLYDTKYEDEHDNKEEKESLKSRGKNRQDVDYPAYEKSLENKGKQDSYDSQPNDGYKKKVYPEGMRENPSSIERGEMSYNSEENLDDRPVYEAVGPKPDKVLPHSRKNGRPKFEDGSYHSNGNHRVTSLEHTDKERLEGSQKSDKEHRNLASEKWQDDGPKEDWNDKITETADSSKELMRDKGEKWLQPPPESGPNDDGYQHRGQIDNTPDGQMLDKEVNSRNRNRGWPENADVDRQQTQMKDHEDYSYQKKPKTGGEYDGQSNVPSRNYISKWQDKQRRPDHKYHHQQAVPDWYNDRGRRPDYPYREYDYIGRGENPRQFWNQYRNDQFKQPHRVVSGNNADLYQPSIDYDNIASFDDEINDDTDDYTTTKQSTSAFEVEKTTVKPTTTKSIVSPTNTSFTEISGNITESPKKTVANNSNNKNGSSHSTLFKKKSSVPDKSLTSAILPLAFGLLITVLLLLLVGCRLRQVNRRLRYGRLKTNVAEADYLINGMYL